MVVTLLVTLMTNISACGLYRTGYEEGPKATVAPSQIPVKEIKVGIILTGDGSGGDSYAHIDGIYQVADDLGLDTGKLIWKYFVTEEQCPSVAEELAAEGCHLIIADNKMYQTSLAETAKAHPDVTFVVAGGDSAARVVLKNFKNAYTKIYEARYMAGVVAGMKLSELDKEGKLPDSAYDEKGNIKMGYIATFRDAENISGYTAFFLGVQSIIKNVAMDVIYTYAYSNGEVENRAAQMLMMNGCVFIGQHTYSPGATGAIQAAYEAGNVCYTIGYGRDMLKDAPDVMLTSVKNNWSIYYRYIIDNVMYQKESSFDWADGIKKDAVKITELGTVCAEGTSEQMGAVVDALKSGYLNIFDTSKFTVDGKVLDSYFIDLDGDGEYDEGQTNAQAVSDGCFNESTLRSAPVFDIIIDGITEMN